MTLVLASSSPRRLELLHQIGLAPDIVDAPETDEAVHAGELPRAYALRMAKAKLAAVSARHPKSYVLAADTVVGCGRRILPKAENMASARSCLALLSGRRHRVYGGIAVRGPDGRMASRLIETAVLFKRLSEPEMETYLATEEWRGKAGGYAIQGYAAALIPAIQGSYSNVVGLALYETAALLTGLGYAKARASNRIRSETLPPL